MISKGEIDVIASRFESPWIRGYVRGKLQADPIYDLARELIAGSALPLLDIGCGMGLLAQHLHAAGDRRRVIGIDHDPRKLALAQVAARHAGLNAEFVSGDARDAVEFRGHVALFDVLHYVSEAEQRSILQLAAHATAPGGLLMIRDCLRDGTWRYYATAVQEHFSRAIGWLRGDRLLFPTRESIVETLAEEGLGLAGARPLWFRTPYNNYLLVFSRGVTSNDAGVGSTAR